MRLLSKILVLEGPDGAGKSTLARSLLAYRVVHSGKPAAGEQVFHTYTTLLREARQSGHAVVFDRLHLGELIYGELVRGKSQLDAYAVTLLNRIINAGGGATVICLPRWRDCEAAWSTRNARGAEYVRDLAVLRLIYQGYKAYARKHQLRVYDWRKDRCMMDHVFYHTYPLPLHVVGSPTPRVLVVGERANPRKNPYDIAFHDRGGCSRFLTEALHAAGFVEEELAFTNALDARGKEQQIDLGYDVIALGKTAGNLARRTLYSRSFYGVPHPQYWRRFHRQEPHTYVDMLKDARSAILGIGGLK